MSSAQIVLTPELLTQLARDVAVARPCSLCLDDPVLTIRGRWVGVSVWHTDKCPACPRPVPVGEVLADAVRQGPVEAQPQT